MATVVLAAAGGALGASVGGGLLGLSSVAIGKAVGASLGAVIDQRLFGSGAQPVEVGRRDMLRLTGSTEGAPIARLWGRMRVPGQIIWSSRFLEDVTTTGGGKGAPSAPERREYSYSVSIAIALCEGPITRIARVWADGQIIDTSTLNMRVYHGDAAQLPDPLIAASLPEGEAPAYRGTAYVVIEDLALGAYGNRIPQFNFEVQRAPETADSTMARSVNAVALVPGTGEYALATEPVSFEIEKGHTKVSNVNNNAGRTDIDLSVQALVEEVPGCGAVSLVVSWFGSDLRCAECSIQPKVEQSELDGVEMPWRVAGATRSSAEVVQYVDGRPGFGGTPADASVVQAIQRLQAAGQAVMFYPFILMDIRAGNGLTDPWSGAADQPDVPWRGRITASIAPGRAGSPDKSPAAGGEVATFFGSVQPGDFAIVEDAVVYSGPAEWSYRRFILHYAWLCKLAGGVDAFCIGSEMRALTQLRDGPESFPTVAQLRTLAAEVKAILPGTKISYAADWSEYFGYQPGDGSGDVFYHLDPLWADPAVDFVGIDNYMPLSDWRDGSDHADAAAGTIHDLDYLRGNIMGGEGYDWYYASAEGRDAQIRIPIEDGAYDEPWTYRYKDIANWWSRFHWNRIGGVKQASPTPWQPEGKPIWFTELGCPAVDKGTNQPNVFLDPQSVENALPHYSTGGQDELIQARYLEAMHSFWGAAENNPISDVYAGPMVDMSRAFVWAWDARPWPDFPQRLDVWADGLNHARGHWISGRTHLVELGDIAREICGRAGQLDIDTRALGGLVRGYLVSGAESARESLQPLMLSYGFDVFEREGGLHMRNRTGMATRVLDQGQLAVRDARTPAYELSRLPESEVPARVRVRFVHPGKDFQSITAEAQIAGAEALFTAGSDLFVSLSHEEGARVAARWLSETQISRDQVSFHLPRSDMDLEPGDVVTLDAGGQQSSFRIDRVVETTLREVEATRVEAAIYAPEPVIPELIVRRGQNQSGQPYAEVMDLPLLRAEDTAHVPFVAATHEPWEGGLSIYTGAQDHDYGPPVELAVSSIVGTTLSDLAAAAPGRWSEDALEVRISGRELLSRSAQEVLNGANTLAVRAAGAADWEVIQFRDAELVGPRQYRLSGLLRGQAGTEPLIPPILAAGADIVLLDGTQPQLPLSLDQVGLERHVRVGPSGESYASPRYRHLVVEPRGVGLRPYAPAHLRATTSGGDVSLSWVRRSRYGGDSWTLSEVPLGEQREAYLVTIEAGGTTLRQIEVAESAFLYTAAMQAADGGGGGFTVSVAQLSASFGPGFSTRIDIP
ncbi:baseplate multidomain protein megatron [Oceanibium sediminis]|uniref:baseplate multidomain protein megatron n=1 Tax=Oceanibium sediminis TaxID=2026339 RepID=UPI000DD47845|nr:glycoside hydrolase/phage tail family protein [Oceanibium sediminis]